MNIFQPSLSGLQPEPARQSVSPDQIIQEIGMLADRGLFQGNREILSRAVDLSARIDRDRLSRYQLAVFHYHVSNVWGNSFRLLQQNRVPTPLWEQSEIEKQLIHNRLAVKALETCDGQSPLSVVCSIITNLANTLFQVGRFMEALAYWDKIITQKPDFSMAVANRGLAMLHYAHLLPNSDHALLYLIQAKINLQIALKTRVEPHARTLFHSHLKALKRVLPRHVNRKMLTAIDEKGASESVLSAFSRWRVKHRLFLNPINDLGWFLEGANDLGLDFPFEKTPSAKPLLDSYYRELTQEFVFSARLYFESVKNPSGTEPDIAVPDSPDVVSRRVVPDVEKLKISFRMAYSLFDKIAFFLQRYYRLPVPENRISFRTVWYRSGKRKNGLHESLMQRPNWPLTGLFWLSKDLYDSRPDFRNGLEHEARELYSLRNHLEHKYLMMEKDGQDSGEPFGNRTISTIDFASRGLRVLKMVRAALIYLALTVYQEENPERQESGSTRSSD